MKKELNLNKKVIVGVLLLTVILIISFTYALFTKTFTSDKAISIKSGSKYIGIYGENKNNIELNNTYTFTIENRGIVDTGFEVYLDDIEKNIDLSTITYEVTGDIIKSGKLSDIESPNRIVFSSALASNDSINISVKLTSTLTGVYKGKLRINYKEYVESFDYIGDVQTFKAPTAGIYKIELWGAQGGGLENTSLGGYVSGSIKVEKNTIFGVYIGGNGSAGTVTGSGGGYNGGGNAEIYNENYPTRFGGGGATDVRLLISSDELEFSSLKSRILVAAGGGGHSGDDKYEIKYRSAGGLIGYSGKVYSSGTGGTQISPGIGYLGTYGQSDAGGFGYGGRGNSHAAGGGSGYYGGGGGARDILDGSGGGGSSFISGHDGCDAIKEESTETNIIHTGQSIHYSGYKFTDTVMIDGEGYKWTTEKQNEVVGMPSHDGLTTMTGNSGNGYAKITFIGQ